MTEDMIKGPCSTRYVFVAEVPLEITVAITIGVWTWYKSRQARLSHDDGSGRLVLLPAYQVTPHDILTPYYYYTSDCTPCWSNRRSYTLL